MARRALLLITLLATCSVGAACVVVEQQVPTEPSAQPPSTAQPPSVDSPEGARAVERTLFDLANRERTERGLDPLEWDERLAQRARAWSTEMRDRGRLEHQNAQAMNDAVEGYWALGENIFRSTQPVAAGRVHVGWMRSEGHRQNILRPVYGRLGVGVLCAEDGSTWATQRFGAAFPRGDAGPGSGVPPEEPIVADPSEGPSCDP